MRAIPNSQELGFFQRTQIVTKILTKLTPGIECIALVNSTALCATHPESDIDLLVVTKP